MNLLKSFLRGVYYFGVGLNATCEDVKAYVSDNCTARRAINGAMCLLLAAAVVTTSGCASREASASKEGSSSETSSQSSEGGESSQAEQTKVELKSDAVRYVDVDNEQLSSLLKSRKKEYEEKVAAEVPTAGSIEEWKKTNSDTVGWINIPDTNIDWPLLYTTNTDFYTHRGYYKEQSKNGVIWYDADTKFDTKGEPTSTNSIIYGHNWTNCWNPIRIGDPQDVMFGQLAAYHYEDFAKSHPYVYINTPAGQHKYQVFTAFYTDLSFKYYYAEFPNKDTTMTYQQMLDKAISLGQYKLGVPVTANDKIITLSTCTRLMGAGDNQRFVVMAKKVS